jgi:hypothetical protein
VCDVNNGQCVTQNLMNNDPCDDLNACTTGEICSNGACANGTPIMQCVAGDNCCPAGCVEATDADCSCNVNLALTATPTATPGGSGAYGPNNWNDGVDGTQCGVAACNACQGWITNTTAADGKWMQYTWPGPVTIGSMYLDTNSCAAPTCYTGRGIASAEVQWWDGAQWVTAQTFSGQVDDVALVFNPPLNTNMVRLFNVAAPPCGQNNNSLMYEWYVWPGSGCTP